MDERVRAYVDGEVSAGDFVLTGGELVALCLVDAVARLLPGVLGNAGSTLSESFEEGLLEYPHYTRPGRLPGGGGPGRPAERRPRPGGPLAPLAGAPVHRQRRPDLLARASLSAEDRELLALREEDL